MAMKTTDAPANTPEYMAQAAQTLGRSKARRKVFKAIYAGKKQVKRVSELMKATRLKRVRVLQEGAKLAALEVVDQETIEGETAYRKRPFIQHKKKRILALADNPDKLTNFPTKWSPRAKMPVKGLTVTLRSGGERVRHITIDQIDNFARVRRLHAQGNLPCNISERQFKEGVQKIIGERGEFHDWGGEANDLFTTRIRIGGKRRPTAFGFKGPGTRGKLTPKKMGKNGDQIQRLFESPAEVFLVQHWREIDQSVAKQMELFARVKSLLVRGEILYGLIDGQDANRLYKAYESSF